MGRRLESGGCGCSTPRPPRSPWSRRPHCPSLSRSLPSTCGVPPGRRPAGRPRGWPSPGWPRPAPPSSPRSGPCVPRPLLAPPRPTLPPSCPRRSCPTLGSSPSSSSCRARRRPCRSAAPCWRGLPRASASWPWPPRAPGRGWAPRCDGRRRRPRGGPSWSCGGRRRSPSPRFPSPAGPSWPRRPPARRPPWGTGCSTPWGPPPAACPCRLSAALGNSLHPLPGSLYTV
mmetsp:Transcript_96883/g.252552  ORF Transcript_96883/g.252552 Transcript_96883/m.252552 type:complete len:229 (-) Transcript_96883:156-842(-)